MLKNTVLISYNIFHQTHSLISRKHAQNLASNISIGKLDTKLEDLSWGECAQVLVAGNTKPHYTLFGDKHLEIKKKMLVPLCYRSLFPNHNMKNNQLSIH